LGWKMNDGIEKEKNQRVVTFLNRNEVDFLDKIGKDALFSSGLKLSRSKIIEWMVDFTKKLDISGDNIKSELDFENKIMSHLPRKDFKGGNP